MDRVAEIKLISRTYEADAIGQQVPVESEKTVFCKIGSISRAEWFDAGRSGLKPSYRVTVFSPDYNGEQVVEIHGKRYGVYRTYLADGEQIELYLEEKVGI